MLASAQTQESMARSQRQRVRSPSMVQHLLTVSKTASFSLLWTKPPEQRPPNSTRYRPSAAKLWYARGAGSGDAAGSRSGCTERLQPRSCFSILLP